MVSILAVPDPATARLAPVVVESSGVTVNGVPAVVSPVADDRLTITLPAGATSGPVVVTTPAGNGTSGADLYVARSPWRATDVEFTSRLLTGTPATAAVAVADRVALLTVAAPVGRRTSLVLTGSTFGSSTSNARVSIFRPDGSTAVSATGFGGAGIFLEPLPHPTAGAYSVLIDSQGSATGQVVVTAYDVPADVTVRAAADGSAVSVTTAVPGQNATVEVLGTAGQRLSVAVSGSTYGASGLQVGFRRPDGMTLVSGQLVSGSRFFDQFVLPSTGTYSIFIDPAKGATGKVDVAVFDISSDATAVAALDGTPATVTTTMPGQNATVTFTAPAGQRISVQVPNHTIGGTPQVSVRRPDGTTLVGGAGLYSSMLIEPFTIPAAGTYAVLIDPGTTATGSAVTRVYALPADDVMVATTMGGGAVTVESRGGSYFVEPSAPR
ncbi:hypothetical protein SAMN05443287_11658 [Micromonospora phaseoli]|uniref:Pre-peptidase C-terminal domain-containing protein n=1 Tax=Micromonospora phaseoli TaxID=1144548 RepID=A0A1H7DQN7_9ACTN|nr:hypothetical protein [Micromonospora phaseoli]PZV89990.1 hypothetical protein CLV64_11477 [Micromonospora phaseoli]GIJ78794.1 hypothetical protein Xph01_32260 [Micromonospora phaseoli]SEK04066.1 hypothetical protein SAMN05443287_11658 [Micromonospora phaseoli]